MEKKIWCVLDVAWNLNKMKGYNDFAFGVKYNEWSYQLIRITLGYLEEVLGELFKL